MSYVTNVIILTGLEDGNLDEFERDPKIEKLEKLCEVNFLKAEAPMNTKAIERGVFVTAFRFFDREKFINQVKSIDWEYPECVQILINDHDMELFDVINLTHNTEET